MTKSSRPRVSSLTREHLGIRADLVDGAGSATLSMAQAGAEFAEFILQAAFNGKSSTVQAYVHLSADAGGEEVKKEIGTGLDYFSVNVQLGVRPLYVLG